MQCIWWPMVSVWLILYRCWSHAYCESILSCSPLSSPTLFLTRVVNYAGKNFPLTSFMCSNLFSVEQTPPVCSAFWFCPHITLPSICVPGSTSAQLNQILIQLWSGPHWKVDTFMVILHKITCIISHPFPDAFLTSGLLYQVVNEFQNSQSLFSSILKIKAITCTWGQK